MQAWLEKISKFMVIRFPEKAFSTKKIENRVFTHALRQKSLLDSCYYPLHKSRSLRY